MRNFYIEIKKPYLKNLGYRFLVEIAKTEKATFPYKTAMSEANAKVGLSPSNKILSFYFNENPFKIMKNAF